MTEEIHIGQPPSLPAPPARPNRPLWHLLAAAAVGALIALGVGAAALQALGGNSTGAASATASPSARAAAAPAPSSVEPAVAAYSTPTTKDFRLTIKILKKECFGSAGCNVTFRVQLTKVTAGDLDPAKTYELTYEITGGEDPQTNTMQITGDSYSYDDQEDISTKSSKSVLKATITSVEEH